MITGVQADTWKGVEAIFHHPKPSAASHQSLVSIFACSHSKSISSSEAVVMQGVWSPVKKIW